MRSLLPNYSTKNSEIKTFNRLDKTKLCITIFDMEHRQYCIYCNKEITTRSSEHVIQNALGGLLESEDICCPECNNYISKYIDAPFTKTFNPIISRIDNFSKTNNTKSMPPCTGTVSYNGREYAANIKNGKVVSCPDLSRELRCDISKLPTAPQIVSYNFDLQNTAFQTGMAKIAFNYAMSQNVDFKYLASGLVVDRTGNTVNSIQYNYPVVPFFPLNPVDAFIEGTPAPTPFHNMILFSQRNELWCYVDLFNTFQYYVLLSDNVPNGKQVYANYTQTLQKLNRSAPVLDDLYDPKTVMIYAQQYGVEPTMDTAEFTRRVNNAVAGKSQKVAMSHIFGPRIARMPIIPMMLQMQGDTASMRLMYDSMHLYFNNDVFQEKNFRTLTPCINGNGIAAYPHETMRVAKENPDILKQYTTMKFNNLNNQLCANKQK